MVDAGLESVEFQLELLALVSGTKRKLMKRSVSKSFLFCAATSAILLLGLSAQGQESPQRPDHSSMFNKTEAMTPMRDGVKLHTEIYVPKDAKEPLPFLLTRSPYGLADDKQGYSQYLGLYTEMFADGYIFVFQDIRGRYGSEGTFVMQRPARDRKDPHSIDEGTDTYDTIDWLIKNVPHNNGRAGEVNLLWWLADGDVAPGASPGIESRLGASVAGRHVPR